MPATSVTPSLPGGTRHDTGRVRCGSFDTFLNAYIASCIIYPNHPMADILCTEWLKFTATRTTPSLFSSALATLLLTQGMTPSCRRKICKSFLVAKVLDETPTPAEKRLFASFLAQMPCVFIEEPLYAAVFCCMDAIANETPLRPSLDLLRKSLETIVLV